MHVLVEVHASVIREASGNTWVATASSFRSQTGVIPPVPPIPPLPELDAELVVDTLDDASAVLVSEPLPSSLTTSTSRHATRKHETMRTNESVEELATM